MSTPQFSMRQNSQKCFGFRVPSNTKELRSKLRGNSLVSKPLRVPNRRHLVFVCTCEHSHWWELTSLSKYSQNVYWTIKHGKSLLYIFRQQITLIVLKALQSQGISICNESQSFLVLRTIIFPIFEESCFCETVCLSIPCFHPVVVTSALFIGQQPPLCKQFTSNPK